MYALRTRSIIAQVLVAALFLLLALRGETLAQRANEGYWVVSIPYLSLTPKERVVGFEVTLRNARVTSLPNVPLEWYVSIDNLSWETRVRGNAAVGAAALEKDFFKDFLVIESSLGGVEKEPTFDIKIEIVTTVDFENERRILLEKRDLLLRKK